MTTSDIIMTMAVLGGLLVVPVRPDGPKQSWPPASGLVVAALLAWLILLIEPNHYPYNLEAFVMPAAVLGTVAIVKLAESKAWSAGRRLAIVGVVLVFVAEGPALKGIDLVQKGDSIRLSDMQCLINLCKSDGATCVGFAPWHPVFCRDATDLYLTCDLRLVLVPWVSAAGKQPYLEMWRRAIPDIESRKPTLIVDNQVWAVAHQSKAIDDDQYNRFLRIVKSRCESVTVGEVTAFARRRKSHLELVANHRPEDKDTGLNHPDESAGL